MMPRTRVASEDDAENEGSEGARMPRTRVASEDDAENEDGAR
jgi:hypothetical protein